MGYLAAVEVDQRQRLISATDKLKEILGGSWTIADTLAKAEAVFRGFGARGDYPNVALIKPVSGELWFRSDDLSQLQKCLWALRESFVNIEEMPCSFAIVEELANPDESIKTLNQAVSVAKRSKTGEVGFPSLPWLAPCLIQPLRYANHWFPDLANHENEDIREQFRRRTLVSENSYRRMNRGSRTLEEYLHRFNADLAHLRLQAPEELEDFVLGEKNGFIGIIRLDADENGRLFRDANWQEVGARMQEPKPWWEALTVCSDALNQCLNSAMHDAVTQVIRDPNTARPNHKFPISPLIAAGEDFLIVTRRDLAVPLTVSLLEHYQANVSASEPLNILRDCRLPGADPVNALTLSGSIVFARQAFPFSVVSEISAEIEHSAKQYRNWPQDPKSQGCIDLYWLESTAREDAVRTRDEGLTYLHGAWRYRLSGPRTLTQLAALLQASRKLRVPRGKWHQLLPVLHCGFIVSAFRYRQWRNSLQGEAGASLDAAIDILRQAGLWPISNEHAPWINVPNRIGFLKETALFDLFRLWEIQRGSENFDA